MEKAIKTVKIPVLENYEACLYVNPVKIQKHYIWKYH